MTDESYLAIIEKVIPEGHRGPYAVAKSTELGSVTFSLKSPVWTEKERPEPGTYVILTNILRKRGGWRANSGRFFKPSDQQSAK